MKNEICFVYGTFHNCKSFTIISQHSSKTVLFVHLQCILTHYVHITYLARLHTVILEDPFSGHIRAWQKSIVLLKDDIYSRLC
jgi:hypothetical protein